jgi:hypothetical protein
VVFCDVSFHAGVLGDCLFMTVGLLSYLIPSFKIQTLQMVTQLFFQIIFELWFKVFARELKELLAVQGLGLAVVGFVEQELVVVG